jgi:hypothetical protein
MPEQTGWLSTRRKAWDRARVREQLLAAPEHDWIGEEPVRVDEPAAAMSSRTSLMLPVLTMSPPVSDSSAGMSSMLRGTAVRSHSGLAACWRRR